MPGFLGAKPAACRDDVGELATIATALSLDRTHSGPHALVAPGIRRLPGAGRGTHLALVPAAMKSDQSSRAGGATPGPGLFAARRASRLYDDDKGLDDDVIDIVAVVVAIVLVTMIALAC